MKTSSELEVACTRNGGTIALLVAATLLLAGVSLFAGTLGILAVHLTILSLGLLAARSEPERRLFGKIYAVNVIAVLGLYALYTFRYGVPYFGGGSDDLMFEQVAQDIVMTTGLLEYGEIEGQVIASSRNWGGYAYVVSLLHRLGDLLGGFHTLMPRILNSGLLAILSLLVYRVARDYVRLSPPYDRVAALVTGLAPIMVWVGAHTFRDILVAGLLFLPVYVFCYRGPTLRESVILAVGLVLLWELRSLSALAAMLLTVASFYSWIRSNGGRTARLMGRSALVLFGIGVVGFIVTQGYVEWIARKVLFSYANYTQLRGARLSSGLAQAVFLAPQPLSSFLRMGYLAVSPFPIPSPEIERSLLSLGTVVQIFFVPFSLYGLYHMIRSRVMLPLILGFAGTFMGVALISFEYRQITMIYPFGALVAAAGFERFRRSGGDVSGVLLSLGAGVILGTVAYMFLTF